jgi:hypothetical protein
MKARTNLSPRKLLRLMDIQINQDVDLEEGGIMTKTNLARLNVGPE